MADNALSDLEPHTIEQTGMADRGHKEKYRHKFSIAALLGGET